MPPNPLRFPSSTLRSTRLPLRTRIPIRTISIPAIQQQKPWKLNRNGTLKKTYNTAIRPFTTTKPSYNPLSSASGKSQADLIVEELQELYETAQDELEIATESTDSATIYAASDRESARDALSNLVIAYELYTGTSMDVGSRIEELQSGSKGDEQAQAGAGAGADGGMGEERIVELSFDPADIEPAAREEVKKRIGQRIREVKNAVELLEKRAHD